MRLVTDLVTLERRERPYPLMVVLEVAVAEEEGEGEPPRFRLGAGVCWRVLIVAFFVRRSGRLLSWR